MIRKHFTGNMHTKQCIHLTINISFKFIAKHQQLCSWRAVAADCTGGLLICVKGCTAGTAEGKWLFLKRFTDQKKVQNQDSRLN